MPRTSFTFKVKPDKPPVEFLSLAETARLCGRTKYTFLELIKRGIMPDANYRTQTKAVNRGERVGDTVQGARLYSKDFIVPKLVEIFKGIRQGSQITQDQKVAFTVAFFQESDYYKNEY